MAFQYYFPKKAPSQMIDSVPSTSMTLNIFQDVNQ